MDSDASMDSDDERFLFTSFGWQPDEYGEFGEFGESRDDGAYGAYGYDYDDGYDDERDDESDSEDDAMEDSTTVMTAAPLPPPPPTLCRFFVLGKCSFGSRCTFSHALPTTASATAVGSDSEVDQDAMATVAATMVDCPFFQRGKCKYGQRCRLRHAPTTTSPRGDNQRGHQSNQPARANASATGRATAANNQQPREREDHTCGICLDDVVEAGKHFGLLTCDHCFCLDCLRVWRQSKEQVVGLTRSCPACRVPSNFIVPSVAFCTGAEKAAAVDAYKRHLAVRECKYFDGKYGSCPFRFNCFYAHRNARGEDVKHLDCPRHMRRQRRGSGSVASAASSTSVGARGSNRRDRSGSASAPRPSPDEIPIVVLDGSFDIFRRYLESIGL